MNLLKTTCSFSERLDGQKRSAMALIILPRSAVPLTGFNENKRRLGQGAQDRFQQDFSLLGFM